MKTLSVGVRDHAVGRNERLSRLGRVYWSKRLLAAVIGMAVAAMAVSAGAGALQWWRAPAVVADHVTASAGSLEMRVGGAGELAQWVVPTRDGLSVIELVLAAEAPDIPGDLVIRIEALADGAAAETLPTSSPATLPPPDRRVILREVRVPARELATGGAFGTGQGDKAERWTPVRFDPVVPSAGRPLLVVLSYPDGGTQPGTRVATLVRFPSSYSRGTLYVTAFRADGTMLVRLAHDETNAAAVRRVLANVATRLPFGDWSLTVVSTLVMACGILWVVVGVGIVLGGSRTPSDRFPLLRALSPQRRSARILRP